MSIPVEKLGLVIGSITDTDGRPFVPSQGNQQFLPNPLPERGGYVADTTAYKEYLSHRRDVDLLFSFFRSAYGQNTLSTDEMLELAMTIHQLPVYLVLRKNNPVDEDALPPSTFDASRAAAGIISVTVGLIMDNNEQAQNLTPEEILQYANGNNSQHRNAFLSRGSTESCPAPERAVRGILEKMYTPSNPDETSYEQADWHNLLNENERNNCMRFGINYFEFQALYNALNSRAIEYPEGGDELISAMGRLYGTIHAALGY